MTAILHDHLPEDMRAPTRLPGIAPLAVEDWLRVDEVFAAQMALRAELLATRRAEVLAVTPGAEAACDELLAHVVEWLRAHAPGYRVGAAEVVRPDGAAVVLDRADPMGTLGHLVQEDLCVMEKPAGADQHVLTAAVLCFPASWRLADKIGRPLTDIHVPVPDYDAQLARRVQRLFDGIQVDRPLWRFNALTYAEAELFQPAPRTQDTSGARRGYHRAERQSLLRLPQTRAVVFSIHSYVVARDGDAPCDGTRRSEGQERGDRGERA